MLKRILLSIVLLLVIAYLVVALSAFNRKPAGQVCNDMELVIKDTVYAGFITKKEVADILEKKGIYPVGKPMDRIRSKTLERELAKHPLIDEVECYKTPSGKLCVEVSQRIPILRVMSANGFLSCRPQVRRKPACVLPFYNGRICEWCDTFYA